VHRLGAKVTLMEPSLSSIISCGLNKRSRLIKRLTMKGTFECDKCECDTRKSVRLKVSSIFGAGRSPAEWFDLYRWLDVKTRFSPYLALLLLPPREPGKEKKAESLARVQIYDRHMQAETSMDGNKVAPPEFLAEIGKTQADSKRISHRDEELWLEERCFQLLCSLINGANALFALADPFRSQDAFVWVLRIPIFY